MSLHVLHAGAGYRYLLRDTATGDAAAAVGADGLAGYHLRAGLPAGVWTGTGLAGLADGAGLPSALPVDETTLGRLFGRGADPATGAALGRGLAEPRRRPDGSLTAGGVSGFDLTFTAPKSASVLWALADPKGQAEVLAAHHAAVEQVLGWVEREVLLTRTGHAGATPLRTRGLVAVRFDRYDSRAGDPNLHSHVAMANRVQGEDGAWRSIDARVLHAAVVAASELYDTLLADELTRRLSVTWQSVDRGPDRTPGHEITGLDPSLLTAFSTRSQGIAALAGQHVEAFARAHGRPPTGVEVTRIRQRATLATRPAKTVHPLPELRARWAIQAPEHTGRSPAEVLAPALPPNTSNRAAAPVQLDLLDPDVGRGVGQAATHAKTLARAPRATILRVGDVSAEQVERLATDAITAVQARRSTWTRLNLLAEAARTTRSLRLASPQDRWLLLADVLDAPHPGWSRCTTPIACTLHAPGRPDGPAPPSSTPSTSSSPPPRPPAPPRPSVRRHRRRRGHHPDRPTSDRDRHRPRRPARATDEQTNAVTAMLTAGRELQVLVGPGGSGKTTTLRALTLAWPAYRGQSSVVGLAPSASAAKTLASSLGVACENTTKWLHETTGPGAQARAQYVHDRTTTSARDAGLALRRVQAEQAAWTIPTRGLVIVDEASLADTHTLAALARQARAAGATLLLVGDPHQTGSVGASGALGLLARRTRHVELAALHRFADPWEAHATRGLRAGDPAALDAYAAHGRLHQAPPGTPDYFERDAVLDAAHAAWSASIEAGRDALLLAPDTATVVELNIRARTHRVLTGQAAPGGVPLRDGTTAGVGDHVRARLNRRRLTDTRGRWVRNGDPLSVSAVHPDGSVTAVRQDTDALVVLPAAYVAEHLELGYALTIHRAQGLTVDEAHLVLGPGATREQLYVGMTRGRQANHAWTTTTGVPGAHPEHDPGLRGATPDHVLRAALASSGVEPSATEQLAATARRQAATHVTAAAVRRPVPPMRDPRHLTR